MKMFDCSCYVGTWPFYELKNKTLDDLAVLHATRGITGGLVSSLNSIFYNDPFEPEIALADSLSNQTAYSQVSVINPLLPGWRYLLPDFCECYPIKGVRIFPGIHGYGMDAPELQDLADLLTEKGLPLFINARMEDFRATYLIVPHDLDMPGTAEFIRRNPELTVILSNGYPNEIEAISEFLLTRENVWADSSYLRGGLFVAERLHEMGLMEKMLFASLSPMTCLESTLQILETAQLPESIMEGIFFRNAEKLFK